jgi:transcriptional regulator with XRE-family HTH domain
MPYAAPIGAAATAAFALIGSALVIGGTGSVFDLSRAADWRRMLEARVPFHVDVGVADSSQEKRPDLRSASDHLANIRQVLNPAIADLAAVFGVSRQAIYKWIGGEATPEPDKFERIRALSHAADAFRDAGITRAPALLKMKAFEGRSLLDLVAAGQISPSHVRLLIAEARAMDAAYDRSGLAKSKAKPSDDWRTEVSIPGTPE